MKTDKKGAGEGWGSKCFLVHHHLFKHNDHTNGHDNDHNNHDNDCNIQDGIIPIINPMGVLSSRNEPTRALLLTVAICQVLNLTFLLILNLASLSQSHLPAHSQTCFSSFSISSHSPAYSSHMPHWTPYFFPQRFLFVRPLLYLVCIPHIPPCIPPCINCIPISSVLICSVSC